MTVRFVMAYKLDIRKSVCRLVGQLPKKEIVRLFQGENISKATIYRTIRECEEGIPCVNLPKSGRPRKLSEAQQDRLARMMKDTIGKSTRKVAPRFGISSATVCRYNARRGLKYRKRKKAPQYSNAQLARIPRCCRNLRRIHFANNRSIVMDDEKYFTFSHAELPGNSGFYTDNIDETPNEVKYKAKAKFADKVLVWCAISERGVSRAFVSRVRGEAVNAVVYIRDCLPKLLNFINQHHADGNYMFWPDLASAHYARATREWLEARNIPYVPRIDNPPNVPQARPIETFWARLAQKVYENGWEARNEQQLRQRIFRKTREIDLNGAQNLMRPVRRVLRVIEERGPLAALN